MPDRIQFIIILLSSHKALPIREMHCTIVLISWVIGHCINGFFCFNSRPHFDCPHQIETIYLVSLAVIFLCTLFST